MSEQLFEYQVQNLKASQKIKFFYNLCRTEIYFQQGDQRGAIPGSIKIIQKTNFTVHAVEHQKRVNRKNLFEQHFLSDHWRSIRYEKKNL